MSVSERYYDIDSVHVMWSGCDHMSPVDHLPSDDPVRQFLHNVSTYRNGIPVVHHCLSEQDLSMPNAEAHYESWEYVSDTPNSDFRICDVVCDDPELLVAAFEPSLESKLNSEQHVQLDAVLSQYRDVFSEGLHDLGCVADDVQEVLRINTGSAPPVTQRDYRKSHHERELLKGIIDDLLRAGFIRPSKSPWMSPCIFVKKKDGTLRLCIDYRGLNKVTVLDPYQLPRIDDMLDSMAGCKYFTAMDLRSGFWQMRIFEEDIPKTGFTTPFGNFEWVRMPFGLVNAPSAFQRLMHKVLGGMSDFVLPYIDDIIIFSRSWEEHLRHLELVLQALRTANLKVKLGKCSFGAKSIRCLGFIVDEHGKHVDPEKVSAILDLAPPTTASAVKSFLGMVGFYRPFIPKFTDLAAPLQDVTKAGVRFVWSAECQASFDALKSAVTSAPCLAYPDFSRPFILTTDWSKQAIGAVLSQWDSEYEAERPIAFASRRLTVAESHYCPTEGECLALVWAVHKYRPYLHGQFFYAHTDHRALEWLDTKRFANSKLERWSMKLQEFSFEVRYKRGSENVVADHLSRVCAVYLAHQHDLDSAVWPGAARTQREIDDVPCTVCRDPGGWDNMVICSGCSRCFHLRCLLPPQSTPPSGDWFCPACDPLFHNLQELYHLDTPLSYRAADPYLDDTLLQYLFGGRVPTALPVDEAQRRSVLYRAERARLHPSLFGWLLVSKRLRHADTPTWLVCPPVGFRWDVIRMVHDALGHSGVEHTLRVMHMHFHWNGIKEDISWFIQCCDACQRRKLKLPAPPELQSPAVYGPFQHLHVDLAGPMDTPFVGLDGLVNVSLPVQTGYVVLMIDYFTKVAEFAVIYNKTALNVARAVFNFWFTRYGLPECLTSDNGSEFVGEEFMHMLSRLGVMHITTAVSHPSANGVVERLVQTVKHMISAHVNDHREHWVQSLSSVRMAYSHRIHGATGLSPNQMLFGFTPRLPLPAPDLVPANSVELRHLSNLQAVFMEHAGQALAGIRAEFERNRTLWQQRRDAARRSRVCHTVAPGDLVLELRDTKKGPFVADVAGPYRVISIRGDTVTLSTGSTARKAARTFDRHISTLAWYFTADRLS